MHPPYFLIGMPGSGKSTLGHHLSQVLGWGFTDLDRYLEALECQPIAGLFAQGEAPFRHRERVALEQCVAALRGPHILALGGGTPCFFDTMDWLLARGITTWIDVPPHALAARLAGAGTATRPLLAQQPNPEAALREMLAWRAPHYARAHHRIAPLPGEPPHRTAAACLRIWGLD